MTDERSRPRFLIVDDDEAIRTQMKWAFADDYEVLLAEDGASAIEAVRAAHPPVVALDLGLPPHPREATEGLLALAGILDVDPTCKVIVITGQGEKEKAIAAVSEGAYDFLVKPIDVEELKILVRRAIYLHSLEIEQRERVRDADRAPFEEMVGASENMVEIFTAIRKVAPSDSPVLILGETGTGKELVARAVHRTSARSNGPFVPINCGAIPDNLLEAELFGHEKGAFTDAHVQRKGRLELAQGGTLFLDEVAELPLALQVKLLRYLQDRVIQRVGGRADILVEARVIAATNADPQQAIREHRLREDLYYRLNVFQISMPALRDRGEDIVLLATTFLQRNASETGKRLAGFTQQALSALRQYSWPGNVRELENRVKRAVVMCEQKRITPEDLELAGAFERHRGRTLRAAREEIDKELIRATLAKHRGNVTKAASELGVSRPTLHELITRYEIER